MPCYHPLTAWRAPPWMRSKKGDIKPIIFDNPFNPAFEELQLPCGQCIGCRLERSRQWAVRCVHEASLYEYNSFITLTYDDDHLPSDMSLHKDHVQKFMKRLRRKLEPLRVRFLLCGEYGSENLRPHYHVLLFGYDFPDKKIWSKSVGGFIYRSDELESLWTYGFSSIGDVTFESAAYVARYVLKKVTGDFADSHYNGRLPEFITMSRRPGIACDWFNKFHSEVYSKDELTLQDGLVKCRPPKYYDKLYEVNHGLELDRIKSKRIKKAKSRLLEYSQERLAVKEEVKNSCLKFLKRYV